MDAITDTLQAECGEVSGAEEQLPAQPFTRMRTGARAAFLHTGWRSGGTWLWSRCRAQPLICGFYEPLHEQAALFRRSDVRRLGPGSWHSGHTETAPYFREYRDLLNAGGRGVAFYKNRFAYDDFFCDETAPADPDLETYIGGLVAHAAAQGRHPVMKFCRSLGRVAWFTRRFPEAAHFVALRDPFGQYRSMERMRVQRRNRYFSVMPLLVIARNLHAPRVRDLILRFGLHVPALHSADLAYQTEICWRRFQRMDEAERYRGFLAFWTLTALTALESSATLIDMGALGADTLYRHAVAQALGAVSGAPVCLEGWHEKVVSAPAPVAGHADAHAVALELVSARERHLSPARYAWLQASLRVAGCTASESPSFRLPVALALAAQTPRSRMQKTATAMAVLSAHALQPLRKLHGALSGHFLGT